MKFLLHVFLCLGLAASALPAHAAHGITVFGDLKYRSGFRHFAYANPQAPKGGTLKLSTTGAFDSVNPFILKGVPAPGVAQYLFQTLMVASYDEPQSYYPLIAQSITVAPDHAYADFVLNPKARWHDGTPITTDDVVWTLRMLKTKAHPLYRVTYAPIDRAEKIGPRTVRFHFSDHEHRELPIIAASMPVLPKRYYATHPFEKTSLDAPLGSGPYRISRVDPGRSITFARVNDYWAANLPSQRGLYNFDTIRFDVYRDDVVALEGIKSHQFDYFEEYIARNWATAYHTPAVRSGALIKRRIRHKIPRGMQAFMFNTREAKFADARVREAIGLTLDFQWMNRTLFYNAYKRNFSYFQNNDPFMATGLPSGAERALLEQWRCKEKSRVQSSKSSKTSLRGGEAEAAIQDHRNAADAGLLRDARNDKEKLPDSKLQSLDATCLPATLFTQPFAVPTTEGDGYARTNLIKAQQLLDDAGWVMRDGRRTHAQTGEVMTIEFLMTQRTFERVIGIMRVNLKKLGIESSFRYVDASQYQRRVDNRQFDIVSIWWNQGLMFPGSEQYTFWHSSQADKKGSQNVGGVKNPIVDDLVTRIMRAQTIEQLTPAARALDRVLLWQHYVIPHWMIDAWRILYWNQFGMPAITPDYNICLECWWMKEKGASGKGRASSKNATQAISSTEPSPLAREAKTRDIPGFRVRGPISNAPSPTAPSSQPSPAGGEGADAPRPSPLTPHPSPLAPTRSAP